MKSRNEVVMKSGISSYNIISNYVPNEILMQYASKDISKYTFKYNTEDAFNHDSDAFSDLPIQPLTKSAIFHISEDQIHNLSYQAVSVSSASRFGGYFVSFLTAFSNKIPFGIHRFLYNWGSGIPSLIRMEGDISSLTSKEAQKWAYISQGFNIASFLSAVITTRYIFKAIPFSAMATAIKSVDNTLPFATKNINRVSRALTSLVTTDVTGGFSPIMKIFASSAGFNITGLFNSFAMQSGLASIYSETKALKRQVVEQFMEKNGTGYEETKADVCATIPHITEKEKNIRRWSIAFASIGSMTGGAAALMPLYAKYASNSRVLLCTTVLSAISGVGFSISLVLPSWDKPNTPGQCKYPPEKDAHFRVIQEHTQATILPWLAITATGMFVFGKFMNQIITQGIKHNPSLVMEMGKNKIINTTLNKNDNIQVGLSGGSAAIQRKHEALPEEYFRNGENTFASSFQYPYLHLRFNRTTNLHEINMLLKEKNYDNPYIKEVTRLAELRHESHQKRLIAERQKKEMTDKEMTK